MSIKKEFSALAEKFIEQGACVHDVQTDMASALSDLGVEVRLGADVRDVVEYLEGDLDRGLIDEASAYGLSDLEVRMFYPDVQTMPTSRLQEYMCQSTDWEHADEPLHGEGRWAVMSAICKALNAVSDEAVEGEV